VVHVPPPVSPVVFVVTNRFEIDMNAPVSAFRPVPFATTTQSSTLSAGPASAAVKLLNNPLPGFPETSELVTATRLPSYYEAGQDITDVDDPVESYQRFIARVIREYESLALIFNFITVDAEQSIAEQHRQIRDLFIEGQRRPWSAWNVDAVAEWLALSGKRR